MISVTDGSKAASQESGCPPDIATFTLLIAIPLIIALTSSLLYYYPEASQALTTATATLSGLSLISFIIHLVCRSSRVNDLEKLPQL